LIAFKLNDGNGTAKKAKVLDDNELLVSVNPTPPLIQSKVYIFSQFLTTDGTSSGSNDMGIDGSSTNVEFYLKADEEEDAFVTKLNFIVGYGASAYLYDFADSGGPLTNGINIYYTDSYNDVITIANITRNYSFLRFSLLSGIIPTAWELRNLGALNDYGYMCSIDLSSLVSPYGVKLDRGTRQKLSILIRDDCTDADIFNCRAFGFRRFE